MVTSASASRPARRRRGWSASRACRCRADAGPGVHHQRHHPAPRRLPGGSPVQQRTGSPGHDPAHGPTERPHRLSPAARFEEGLHRAGHQPGAGEEGLPSDGPGHRFGCPRRDLRWSRSHHERGEPGGLEGGRGDGRSRRPGRSRRYDQPVTADRRTAARTARQGGRDGVAAATTGRMQISGVMAGSARSSPSRWAGDPVGHPQRAGQEGTVGLLDQDQPGGGQRRVGEKSAPGPGRPRRRPAQLEAQADGGPAAGHVIVEVAVQALEAAVEVGRQGDQQQIHVEIVEPGPLGQAAQPDRRSGRLDPGGRILQDGQVGGVGPLDRPSDGRRRPAGGRRARQRGTGPRKGSSGRRVVPAAVGDQGPDPASRRSEAGQQVGRRRDRRRRRRCGRSSRPGSPPGAAGPARAVRPVGHESWLRARLRGRLPPRPPGLARPGQAKAGRRRARSRSCRGSSSTS